MNAEFLAADRGVDDLSRRWLEAQGVRSGIIEAIPGPMIVARIETYAHGCFEFSEDGERAFVHPVWDGGDLADLIAWRPSDPTRWWTCCYTGTPLGVDQLAKAEIEGLPLAIRRTPLSWLIAGGDGVVITDWAMSAAALHGCPILVGEDTVHGDDIERRLSNSSRAFPEIRIMKSKLEAV